MQYLSVCSGIEAATVAWRSLGWSPIAFSEIDPFPCAVLAHHYPRVPNFGDMTRFEAWPDATPDLMVGGTPCQSFSIAGWRTGLVDPRGALLLVYLALARRYRPVWLVWENTPGALSVDRGCAFATFLGALADLGYGFAYRVLDAQYFGVPQRRRRLFVVAHRDWRRAAAVLFERACLARDSATGGAEESTTATDDRGGAAGAFDGPVIANGLTHRMHKGINTTADEGQTMIVDAGGVRLLTPVECERLQGFPDHYTRILYRGRPAKDGHRFRALGNSMAVPVMAWIGQRIATIDRL